MVLLLGVCLVVAGDFGARLIFRYPPQQPTNQIIKIKENQHFIKPILITSNLNTSHNRINQPRTPPRNNKLVESTNQTTTTNATINDIPSFSLTNSISIDSFPSFSSSSSPPLPSTRPALHHSSSVTFEQKDSISEVKSSSPIETQQTQTRTSSSNSRRRRSTGRSLLHQKSLISTSSTASKVPVSSTLTTPSAGALPVGNSGSSSYHRELVWGLPVFAFLRFFSPLSSSSSSSSNPRLLDVTVNTVRFLSYPVHLPPDSRHELTSFAIVFALRDNAILSSRHSHESNLNFTGESINWANHVTALYASILVSFSNALLSEQIRVGFLSQQANIMHTTTEQYILDKQLLNQKPPPLSQQIPPPVTPAQTSRRKKKEEEKIEIPRPTSPSSPSSPELPSSSPLSLCSLLQEKSILACHFTSLYKISYSLEQRSYRCTQNKDIIDEDEDAEEEKNFVSLKENFVADADENSELALDDVCGHLLFNNWLHFYISLSPQTLVPPHINQLLENEAAESNNGEVDKSLSDPPLALPFPIQPFQTLLLRTSATRLIATLSIDTSPLLNQFILHLHPTISFSALSNRLSLPLSTILLLASHLLNWNAATLIDTIALTQKYVIAPYSSFLIDVKKESPLISYLSPTLRSTFQKQFPHISLVEFLAEFNTPKILSVYLREETERLNIFKLSSLSSNQQLTSSRGALSPFLWSLQRGLLMQCKTYLVDIDIDSFSPPIDHRGCCSCCQCNRAPLSICRSRGRCVCSSCRSLSMILPYCNGKHHLSSIVWAERENELTLEKLEQIISTHSHRIISVLHI